MPLLRSLTTKLKTKLTISPPASPTTSPSGSTSSFENLGGERKTWRPQSHIQSPTYTHGQNRNQDAGSSVESFNNDKSFGQQKRPQSRRADTGSSELSFGCVGIDARVAVEELEKVRVGREERRRSKFREEF
ncbi:hypothetical protein DPSP01_007564 [Paraphaeosphaeria sporulosa]